MPTSSPSAAPSTSPSIAPTGGPTKNPTGFPTKSPSGAPSGTPTREPTYPQPTGSPSARPTRSPLSAYPTVSPNTPYPSRSPTTKPPTIIGETFRPSRSPTSRPSFIPTTGECIATSDAECLAMSQNDSPNNPCTWNELKQQCEREHFQYLGRGTCRKDGKTSGRFYQVIFGQGTLYACKNRCLERPWCVGFEFYNPRCELWKVIPTDANPGSQWRRYQCFVRLY